MAKYKKWSIEKTNQWQEENPWLVGANFIPSTAINQLEMWQADTFDPETIDRELGWAEDLGFNAMRVYLHDLLWLQDAEGLKNRINQYLEIADHHHIRTMFVFFDDCWHDSPKPGKQPVPEPGIHNSGWVQSPGIEVLKDPSQWARLEEYVVDIVTTFGQDERVVLWDIYNEPGNTLLPSLNLPLLPRVMKILGQFIKHYLNSRPSRRLLESAFNWARSANPQQPLTAGLYCFIGTLDTKLNDVSLALSDIVSFHFYHELETMSEFVDELRKADRPLICTEYLARSSHCTFDTHLPYFKERNISCFNWGLVSGKTQTIYSWTDHYPNGEEPPIWFHDIFHKDGSLYNEEEGALILSLTGK